MKSFNDRHAAYEISRICQFLTSVHKRIRRQGVPDDTTDAQ